VQDIVLESIKAVIMGAIHSAVYYLKGRLSASRPGEETTFAVRLPRDGDAPPAPVAARAEQGAAWSGP
jgi:hypothetical protein